MRAARSARAVRWSSSKRRSAGGSPVAQAEPWKRSLRLSSFRQNATASGLSCFRVRVATVSPRLRLAECERGAFTRRGHARPLRGAPDRRRAARASPDGRAIPRGRGSSSATVSRYHRRGRERKQRDRCSARRQRPAGRHTPASGASFSLTGEPTCSSRSRFRASPATPILVRPSPHEITYTHGPVPLGSPLTLHLYFPLTTSNGPNVPSADKPCALSGARGKRRVASGKEPTVAQITASTPLKEAHHPNSGMKSRAREPDVLRHILGAGREPSG
jgi:hypothetical protein